jgi:hypothetical protein
MMDMKGDFSGVALAGSLDEKLQARIHDTLYSNWA